MSKNLYCTNNDCYKAGEKLVSVEHLIVHTPAVYPTPIRAQSGSGGGWHKRWNRPGVEKLTHGVIDDTGVYNFAPYTMAVWQVGNAYGNAHCIGYELCELVKESEFNKVWDNAVDHYAYLCKRYGLSVDRILGHCEAHDRGIASNHSDPEPYFRRFGKSMKDFRADVQKRLSGAGTGSQDKPAAKPTVTKRYNPYAYARVTNLPQGDTLNVRTEPDPDAKRISVWPELGDGNEVDVIEMYSNGWVKINIQGTKGYVNANYLDITDRSPEETAKYTEWAGQVYNTGSLGLVVRTAPDINAPRLASWPKLWDGNMVSVTGEEHGYYSIRISNERGTYNGYASADYIRRA